MKKTAAIVILLLSIKAPYIYGQHSVNDIKTHNGWYKISIESDENGNSQYTVTQCYPSGEEYRLSDAERQKVPLWVKVFCISLFEEGLKGSMDSLSFGEDGFYMRMTGFILTFDTSKTDEEVLEMIGPEVVDRFKYIDW